MISVVIILAGLHAANVTVGEGHLAGNTGITQQRIWYKFSLPCSTDVPQAYILQPVLCSAPDPAPAHGGT